MYIQGAVSVMLCSRILKPRTYLSPFSQPTVHEPNTVSRTHLRGLVVRRRSQHITSAIEVASSSNSEWSTPRNRDVLSRSGVLPAFLGCYSHFSCSPSPRPTFNQKSKDSIVRYSVVLIRRNQYLEMPVQMFFSVPFQSTPFFPSSVPCLCLYNLPRRVENRSDLWMRLNFHKETPSASAAFSP
jgi:hypothetical protein